VTNPHALTSRGDSKKAPESKGEGNNIRTRPTYYHPTRAKTPVRGALRRQAALVCLPLPMPSLRPREHPREMHGDEGSLVFDHLLGTSATRHAAVARGVRTLQRIGGGRLAQRFLRQRVLFAGVLSVGTVATPTPEARRHACVVCEDVADVSAQRTPGVRLPHAVRQYRPVRVFPQLFSTSTCFRTHSRVHARARCCFSSDSSQLPGAGTCEPRASSQHCCPNRRQGEPSETDSHAPVPNSLLHRVAVRRCKLRAVRAAAIHAEEAQRCMAEKPMYVI
jgi:hypothetical protein